MKKNPFIFKVPCGCFQCLSFYRFFYPNSLINKNIPVPSPVVFIPIEEKQDDQPKITLSIPNTPDLYQVAKTRIFPSLVLNIEGDIPNDGITVRIKLLYNDGGRKYKPITDGVTPKSFLLFKKKNTLKVQLSSIGFIKSHVGVKDLKNRHFCIEIRCGNYAVRTSDFYIVSALYLMPPEYSQSRRNTKK